MKKWLMALVVFAGMLAATGAYAEKSSRQSNKPVMQVAASAPDSAQAGVSVPKDMLEEHASPWKSTVSAVVSSPLGLIVCVALISALGVVAFVVLRRPKSSKYDDHPAFYETGYATIDPNLRLRKEPSIGSVPVNTITKMEHVASWNVPADFDVPRFLRKSKAAFVRLQASWDNADLKDIRAFTSREIFTEMCHQLKARGPAPNVTEVVTLGAELVRVETLDESMVATVKFTGMIKEAPDTEVMPFSEVWNLSKPTDGRRSWMLAGIQQY